MEDINMKKGVLKELGMIREYKKWLKKINGEIPSYHVGDKLRLILRDDTTVDLVVGDIYLLTSKFDEDVNVMCRGVDRAFHLNELPKYFEKVK